MDAHDRLLRIVNEIYAAVGDPTAWTPCLTSICDLLGGSGANLLYHDLHDHHGGIVASVVDPAAFEAYAKHFHSIDPWALKLRPAGLVTGRVIRGSTLVSHDDFQRTEYYGDFGRRFGLTRTLIGVIDLVEERLTTSVTVNRSDSQPDFDEDSERLLGALVPHLRRALFLHQQLAGVDAERAVLADVLDRLRAAVMLVNTGGDVLLMNHAARALVARRDGITMDGRRLRAVSSQATAALARAVAQAVAIAQGGTTETDSGHIALPKPSGGQALEVRITPVARAGAAAEAGAAAALFITDPDEMPLVPTDWLTKRFRLTPAEARIASALARGEAVADIADRLRVTTGTARWYVKQILAKTGTNRQADLVRLLVGIVAGLGGG
jgi:DNA-binding CsgD family transcriptional regulator